MTPSDILKLPYRPCVGIMLINADNLVFAAQRLDSTYDAWQMPQGGVEKGEDPDQAALRELKEETGVDQTQVQVLAQTNNWIPYDLPHELVPKLWKGKYRGQEQKWYLMRFLGSDADINIQTETPEFSKWQWMPIDQVVSKIVPFKRNTYEQLAAEFAPYFGK